MSWLRFSYTSLALMALIQPTAIYANEAPRALARAFVGHCINNIGRNDKVEAAASVFAYDEMVGEDAKMLAPQDPAARYRMWIAKGSEPKLFMLGVSWAMTDGIEVSNCVIGNPEIDLNETLVELRKLVNLGSLQYDDDSGGQRYRIWGTDNLAPASFITLTDARKMGIVGGTLSLSSPSEK